MSFLPDWVTGFDRENSEAGLEADRRNAELTEDLRRRQLISDQEARESQQRINDSLSYDPDDAIGEAFGEGFDDGADNIRGAVGSTINAAVGTPLKLIPWQLWIALALYGAWKLGLFKTLLSKVKT